ncbi:MAG TPA: hypothetical protein VFS99_02365 [Xanthomonadaceae bacterium]|nr:hypothetical protein [Xanthomonadaceae bacterium]
MRVGAAEADRAQDAGQERHVVVLELPGFHLALLRERVDHVQPEDVGLAFLEARRVVLQRLRHGALAIERVLDAQAVRDLVEHRVLEERVEGHVVQLVLDDELVRDRHHDLVELRAHHVLQLQPAGALGQLHFLVVGQVDGDGLGADVRVAAVVHGRVRVEVGVGPRHLRLVLVRDRQAALQLGQELREARQALAPCHVLDQHQPLVRGLVAEQLVLVALNRTNHHVHRVAAHVHPGHVAGLELAGEQRVGAHPQVIGEAFVRAVLSGLAEQRRRAFQVVGVRDVVRHGDQFARIVAPQQRVPGRLVREVGLLELGLRHVGGVEHAARRARADAFEQRGVGIEPVPRAVVDPDQLAGGVVRRPGQQRLAVARPGLLPEQVVHHLRGLHQQGDHPLAVLVERGQVRGERHDRVIAGVFFGVGGCRLGGGRGFRRRGFGHTFARGHGDGGEARGQQEAGQSGHGGHVDGGAEGESRSYSAAAST